MTAVAAAVARLWPEVLSNAVDPGRVPTKTGGPRRSGRSGGGAPRTQEWLASGEEPKVLVSGGCTASRCTPRRAVHDETFQDRLLDALAEETGTSF
ncbi:hypothetical protein [Streptomyces sp. NRRL B-3229]|uniref:hypothetical protein n=1 Tax=Streptomyces sp. NRRL B-3229 TaxID=1463836 RepID=UPI001F178AF4|nr:hypothetical protein [Streptomyces sp. NRRL B-3229]